MPQKDDKLLHDLIEKHAKLFAKYAQRYGVPIDDAEDIAMEAIWSFYNSRHYEELGEEEAKIMMATIVKRKSIDYYRRENKDDITVVDIDDEESPIQISGPERYQPENTAVANEGYQRIVRTIESLKDIWREPVKMFFVEQRTYAEISEALGISEDVCRSRISRARKVLEEELGDMLDKPSRPNTR